jgi:hypothetical protein
MEIMVREIFLKATLPRVKKAYSPWPALKENQTANECDGR